MFKLCDLGRLTIVYQSSHICHFLFYFEAFRKRETRLPEPEAQGGSMSVIDDASQEVGGTHLK